MRAQRGMCRVVSVLLLFFRPDCLFGRFFSFSTAQEQVVRVALARNLSRAFAVVRS